MKVVSIFESIKDMMDGDHTKEIVKIQYINKICKEQLLMQKVIGL
jgi:hypothetical protein